MALISYFEQVSIFKFIASEVLFFKSSQFFAGFGIHWAVIFSIHPFLKWHFNCLGPDVSWKLSKHDFWQVFILFEVDHSQDHIENGSLGTVSQFSFSTLSSETLTLSVHSKWKYCKASFMSKKSTFILLLKIGNSALWNIVEHNKNAHVICEKLYWNFCIREQNENKASLN